MLSKFPGWEAMELPPRTRRIRGKMTPIQIHIGTTSAHAENTCVQLLTYQQYWNYLRARGEYVQEARTILNRGELPPRTRRIRGTSVRRAGENGTTSAHAENTLNELGLL